MRMERVDVMFSAETSGGSWVVLVQNGPKAKATYFKGDDAQRLAYEYAAGVLGKNPDEDPDPFLETGMAPVGPPKPNRDRVIQRLTSSIMYGFTGTTPPYAGQISEFVTGLIDSLAPASPWISVKEMGPAKRPNGPNTFVIAAKAGEYIRLAETDGTYWHNLSNGTRLEGVTHWMPLPEPPKE